VPPEVPDGLAALGFRDDGRAANEKLHAMTAKTSSRSGVARLPAAVAGLWGAGLWTVPALAGSGQPSPKQMIFQDAVTPIAE